MKEFSAYIPEETSPICSHKGGEHDWFYSEYCGSSVCSFCGQHAHLRRDGSVSQELARCFCGWNLEPGERLDDDVDY